MSQGNASSFFANSELPIEGKFGQAKRRFGLGRIMAKLSDTAESSIAITFLVINLEQLLKQLFLLCQKWLVFLGACFGFSEPSKKIKRALI